MSESHLDGFFTVTVLADVKEMFVYHRPPNPRRLLDAWKLAALLSGSGCWSDLLSVARVRGIAFDRRGPEKSDIVTTIRKRYQALPMTCA